LATVEGEGEGEGEEEEVARAERVGRERGMAVTLEELRGWFASHPRGLTPAAVCTVAFQDLTPLARFVAVGVALAEAHPRWVDRTATGLFRVRGEAARLPSQDMLADVEVEEQRFAERLARGLLTTAPGGPRGLVLQRCAADIIQYALALPNDFFEPVLARKCSFAARKGMHQEEMIAVLTKSGALPQVVFPQGGAVEVLYEGRTTASAVQDINELRVANRWKLPLFSKPRVIHADAAAPAVVDDKSGREVYRGIALAIDSPETTDVDDAVSCERLPSGSGLRVRVHVADVASRMAVRQAKRNVGIVNGPEARRGTSVYLPSRVFHMCDDAATLSLSEKWDSPAFTTSFDVSESGEISNIAFAPTLLPRVVRVTYDQVDAMLLVPPQQAHAPLHAQISLLAEASARLGRAREVAGTRGNLINLPKITVKTKRCAKTGLLLPVLAREVQTPANKLVEHLMVAANMAAGRHFVDKGLPGLFRAQLGPTADVPDLDAATPIHVRLQTIRLMSPARITSTPPLGHHSLGIPAYMQTTSPIRRLGDLVSQALLRDGLSERDTRQARDVRAALPLLVEQCNEGQIWTNTVQMRANRFWINEWVRGSTQRAPVLSTVTQILPPNPGAAGKDKRILCWVDEIAQECLVTVPLPMWTGNATPGSQVKVHLVPDKKPSDRNIKATAAEAI
jgi:hypothetical protein